MISFSVAKENTGKKHVDLTDVPELAKQGTYEPRGLPFTRLRIKATAIKVFPP